MSGRHGLFGESKSVRDSLVRSWRREMYDRESSVLLGEEQCLVEESVVSLC